MADIKRLLKSQAAELAGMTQAGLSSAMKGGNPPPMAADGYPCREYGDWLRKRALADVGFSSNGECYDLKAEQARLNFHQANIRQLEEAELRGDLQRSDAVLKEWQGIVANVRARLLSLPSKLAAQGYGARSRGELQRLLQEGIAEALAELAGGHHADE
jgi:phage terminase Nu1 subunit (DNA packaging protein)